MKSIPDSVQNDQAWYELQDELDAGKLEKISFSKTAEEKQKLKEMKKLYKQTRKN